MHALVLYFIFPTEYHHGNLRRRVMLIQFCMTHLVWVVTRTSLHAVRYLMFFHGFKCDLFFTFATSMLVQCYVMIDCAFSHCGLVMPYGDRSGRTLACVTDYSLTAQSHYLNQCWLIIGKNQWQVIWGPLNKRYLSHQSGNLAENYLPKISSHRGQWFKRTWQYPHCILQHLYSTVIIS